jgi:hypothetical protein
MLQRFDACKNKFLLLESEWDKSGVVEVSVLLRCGTASLDDRCFTFGDGHSGLICRC